MRRISDGHYLGGGDPGSAWKLGSRGIPCLMGDLPWQFFWCNKLAHRLAKNQHNVSVSVSDHVRNAWLDMPNQRRFLTLTLQHHTLQARTMNIMTSVKRLFKKSPNQTHCMRTKEHCLSGGERQQHILAKVAGSDRLRSIPRRVEARHNSYKSTTNTTRRINKCLKRVYRSYTRFGIEENQIPPVGSRG